MKAVFNRLPFFRAALLLALAVPQAGTAQSGVFHSVRSLLGDQFRASRAVTFERVHAKGQTRARIEARLGYTLPKPEYIFYVARTDEHIDGFALFDRELGQHEPIDVATFFDSRGQVTRVEVVAYREPYGDGIRSARFRKQFVGRSARSRFQAGRDVDIVSGATISSRSMCRAVERASVLLNETLLRGRGGALAQR